MNSQKRIFASKKQGDDESNGRCESNKHVYYVEVLSMHSTSQTSKACNNIWVSNCVIVLRIDILSKLRRDYLNMRGTEKL